MTNQEIYDAALSMACEVEVPNANEDYRERATYLIAALCYRYAPLDVRYREAQGLEKQNLLPINCLPLSATFPLCDDFGTAVSTALAGMLTLSENPDMSARLSALADEMFAELRARIPYQKERIAQMYNL